MFGLDSILGGIGDIAGYFAGKGDRNAGMDALEKSRQGYQDIDPNIKAQETGASNFNNAGVEGRAQQLDILSQLRNKYNSGGLDALDRGRVAEINQATSQAGQASSEAAKQDAARRGLLNSASSVTAQQVAGQNAAQVGSAQGVQAAAAAEQARRASLNQAGYMAGQTRGQDYEKAAAQDAIARFNAGQRQGAEVSTLQGKLARQHGIAGVSSELYGAHNKQADQTRRIGGEIGSTAGSVGNFFLPTPGGAGGGMPTGAGGRTPEAWMSSDMGVQDGGSFAEGGMVPGQPSVPGDSPANDTRNIKASPGEVVLPRTIVERIKELVTRKGPSQSSPSVFDAKAAMEEHNRRLQQALEGAR